MQFDLVKPCDNCPFRTDIRPYLRKGRIAAIKQSLVRDNATFACHKTTRAGGASGRKQQHCAGALILCEKTDTPAGVIQIAERLGLYDPSRLDMSSPVFNSWEAADAAQE